MTGAVYDRGYRPYEGTRGGRASSRAALYRATIRRALGLRRSWRQKIAPFVLLAIVTVPAIVNVGVKYLTRNTPASDIEFFTFREYVGVSTALLVFVALTAPDIMCPDRRQRVLPLVFARPLTGVDYVIAKLGAMVTILFAFSFLPQVVLFVGQMLVDTDGAMSFARENAEILWQAPVAVAVLSIFYSAIGVAISSLASRRIIAGAAIIGLFLVTSIVSAILVGPEVQSVRTAPPATLELPEGEVGEGPFGGDGGFEVDDEPSFRDGFQVIENDPSPAPLMNMIGLPLLLRDAVFLGQVDTGSPLSGYANGGWYALAIYLLIVAACIGTLLYRYDEVER